MKLSELQRHEINEAHIKAADVLGEIKNRVLKGNALRAMKTLEAAVQNLELFLVQISL